MLFSILAHHKKYFAKFTPPSRAYNRLQLAPFLQTHLISIWFNHLMEFQFDRNSVGVIISFTELEKFLGNLLKKFKKKMPKNSKNI